MVMPQAMAPTCPQCGADVRLSGTRCKSCGFWLPAAPARRTTAPPPRPSRAAGSERRQMLAVLVIGGFVALGLFAAGIMVWFRQPEHPGAAPRAAAVMAEPLPSATPRLEPSALLSEARRKATSWRQDAVLVSLNAGPLDDHGVSPDGKLELTYAEPSGQRVSGGADTGAERLILDASASGLSMRETRGAKSRIAPEPNCLFEDAWATALRSGERADAASSLRYAWSEKHARPLWEVVSQDGQVTRRLDGVTCSILTR